MWPLLLAAWLMRLGGGVPPGDGNGEPPPTDNGEPPPGDGEGNLHTKVKLATGPPIAGAVIDVQDLNQVTVGIGTTDADGLWVGSFNPGSYRVVAKTLNQQQVRGAIIRANARTDVFFIFNGGGNGGNGGNGGEPPERTVLGRGWTV